VTDPSVAWKLVFVSVFALLSNTVLGPYFTDDERLGNDPSIPIVSVYGYLLGGLFVGFGAKLGNGCTTGNGICGMARLSKRSIILVCTFMASAFAMSALVSPDNKAFSSGTDFLRTEKVPEFYNRWSKSPRSCQRKEMWSTVKTQLPRRFPRTVCQLCIKKRLLILRNKRRIPKRRRMLPSTFASSLPRLFHLRSSPLDYLSVGWSSLPSCWVSYPSTPSRKAPTTPLYYA
jgi:hypothetical protein